MLKRFNSNLTVQILTSLAFVFVILSLIISYIGYYEFTEAIEYQYESKTYNTARTAIADIDKSIFTDTNLNELQMKYRLLRQNWKELADTQGATFIYMYKQKSDDYKFMRVLISVMNSSLPYNEFRSGIIIDLPEVYIPSFKEVAEKGAEKAAVKVYRQEYSHSEYASGDHITVILPVYGADGKLEAFLGVEREMRELQNARSAYVRHIWVTALIFLLIVLIRYGFYLNKRLLSPVQKISREAQRFASENTRAEVSLGSSIQTNDEIARLAQTIDKMEDDVLNYIKNLTRVTQEKEQIKAELDIAARIQAGILPRTFPPFPDRDEFEIYASMTPAKEVGGDFYDFFMVDKDHLALVIADVSGKGVPAALFMMTAKTLIKNRAKMGGLPSEILYDVNMQLCEGNEAELFVTVWLGILEISTGKIIAANAGHEYPAVKHAGDSFNLFKTKNSPAVAAMEGMRFRDSEFELKSGDILYIYTDGVAEATNSDNELFGTDRMLEALNAIDDNASSQDILLLMKAKIDAFTGDAPQFDDITMICVKYFGNKNN